MKRLRVRVEWIETNPTDMYPEGFVAHRTLEESLKHLEGSEGKIPKAAIEGVTLFLATKCIKEIATRLTGILDEDPQT